MSAFWNDFKSKNESKQDAFEDLSMFLCARKLKVKKIDSYKNQPGIETEPFEVNGKKYGFQAKYFESGFDWKQIEKSITKAINLYQDLDKIFIYSNEDRTKNASNPTQAEKRLEALRGSIKLEYITEKQLKLELSKPENFDLLQVYFGYGDELGFIKNQLSPAKITEVLNAKDTHLPLSAEQKIEDIVQKLLDKTNKNLILLSGSAGSGKTIIARSIFYELVGLFEENKSDSDSTEVILNKIKENGSIPMYISFKDCLDNITLEELIRNRQKDYKLRNQEGNKNLKFLYILDGLDEISEDKVDSTLSYIQNLKDSQDTKSILVSCRKANPNIFNFRQSFSSAQECEISKLNVTFNKEFIKPFSYSEDVIKHIEDIYTLFFYKKLLSKGYDPKTIFEIYKLTVDSYFNNLEYRKNLYKLNIPNLKKQQIIEFNKEVSLEFYKKFQFRFRLDDLQKIANELFPKCSYKDINEIINYNASLFFDTDENEQESYIYKHRKLQDYFFIMKLEEEYFKNRQVLRDFDILGNSELISNFYDYIRDKYWREIPDKKDFRGKEFYQGDLLKIIEVNLSYLYLTGKKWWKEKSSEKYFEGGNDKPVYFQCYDEFIKTLVSFSPQEFERLLEDEILDLKNKIVANPFTIKALYKSGHEYYKTLQEKFKIWRDGRRTILKDDKVSLEAKKDAENSLNNLILNNLESYLWLKKHLDKDEQFINWLIENTDINKDIETLQSGYNQKPALYYIFSFLVEEKDYEKIDKIIVSDKHLTIFCEVISNIPDKLIKINELRELTKNKLERFPSIQTLSANFCKKILGLNFTHDPNTIPDYKREDRPGWDYDISDVHKIAFLENSCEVIINSDDDHYRNYYFNSQRRSYELLYSLYIQLLFEKIDEYELFKTLTQKITFQQNKNSSNLIIKIILNISNFEDQKNIVDFVINNNLVSLNYLLVGIKGNDKLFNFFYTKLNIKDEVDQLENWQGEWHDHFIASMNLIQIIRDKETYKAKEILKKAISISLLRHGWRKDYIVSSFLNKSLEILWKNKTTDYETLLKYSDRVCSLNFLVDNKTDGKGTRWGKDRFLEIITEYDLKLAIEYYEGKRLSISKPYNNSDYYGYVYILVKKISYIGSNEKEVEKWLNIFNSKIRYNNYDRKVDEKFLKNKFYIYINIINENKWLSDNYKKEKLEDLKNFIENHDLKSSALDFKYDDEKELEKKLIYFNKKYKLGLKIEKGDNNNTNSKTKESDNHLEQIKKPEDLINYLYSEGLLPYPSIDDTSYTHKTKLISKFYKDEKFKLEIEDYLLKYCDYAGFPEIIKLWNELGETKKVNQYFLNFLEFCEFLLKNNFKPPTPQNNGTTHPNSKPPS